MVSAVSPQAEVRPFGPPDGARADLDEIQRNFVTFADQPALDDLASPASDRSARLIVGKKGVGKTVYLKRFQANAAEEESIYADEVRHDVPATEDVIRVCELYPAELAAEGWQWIWRRAIMRTLVSHVLGAPELRDNVPQEHRKTLEADFPGLLRSARRPSSIYAEASNIAVEATNRHRLARELRHRDWDDIEHILGRVLPSLRPVCFYLDSVDEKFGRAPLYWLQCQKGLCDQVLELHRDPRFGNRLHIVVAIRDLVRSSLMHGEHATRYMRTRHIRLLDWDHPSIAYFLHEKIRRLRPRFRMDTRSGGVNGWLGRDVIYNHSRGVDENLEDYLLRHTRLIPRDVVHLGNELSSEVAKAKGNGERALSDEAIRRAVAVVSKDLADEQIAVCANHLASDTTHLGAGRERATDFYTSALYSNEVEAELCRFIATVGFDRFPMSRLEQALRDMQGGVVLRSHPNPLNVLWQNGLLGYDPPNGDSEQSHFYGAQDMADFHLPDDLQSYVFHPILGHKVRIMAAGERPVRGFR